MTWFPTLTDWLQTTHVRAFYHHWNIYTGITRAQFSLGLFHLIFVFTDNDAPNWEGFRNYDDFRNIDFGNSLDNATKLQRECIFENICSDSKVGKS